METIYIVYHFKNYRKESNFEIIGAFKDRNKAIQNVKEIVEENHHIKEDREITNTGDFMIYFPSKGDSEHKYIVRTISLQ